MTASATPEGAIPLRERRALADEGRDDPMTATTFVLRALAPGDTLAPEVLDAFPLLTQEDRAAEFHTFDLANDADMAKAVLIGRYENTVRDLEACLRRAEAMVEAYRRGWRLVGGTSWYSGHFECDNVSLSAHLATLAAKEKPNVE